jgi:pilus assembly protein CpaE
MARDLSFGGNGAPPADAEPTPPIVAVVDTDAAAQSTIAIAVAREPEILAASIAELEERLSPGAVSVVIFGPAFCNPQGLSAIQAFGQGRPEVGAILVAHRLATKLLKAALRAGIRDVLVEPVDPADLADAVDSIGRILSVSVPVPTRPTEPGRVVTVFSPKGGVGTSVLAANLAALLARTASGPVALVDAHIEFGDVAVLFNVAPRYSIADAIAPARDGDTDLVQRLLTRHEDSGVLVLPAPVDPQQVDMISGPDVLAVIDSLKQLCSYVVVDTPSTFNDVVLTALEASDEIVLVSGDDVPAVKNLKIGLQALQLLNLPAARLSLVLNRVHGNPRVHGSEVERALGFHVDAIIPADPAVAECVNRGTHFVLNAPKSKPARAIEALAIHITSPRPRAASELTRSN